MGWSAPAGICQDSGVAKRRTKILRNEPRDAAVFGVGIGKTTFHVVGLDDTGQPILKVKLRRNTLPQFFERAAPAIVGMEACGGNGALSAAAAIAVVAASAAARKVVRKVVMTNSGCARRRGALDVLWQGRLNAG